MEAIDRLVEVDRDEYDRLKRMEANLFPATEPQMLDTGKFGQIFVVQTWASSEMGMAKIHKQANGNYCYDSGLPVDKKKALDVIPAGPERDAAYYWFDHRHDEDETTKQRRGITVNPDLSLTFSDGAPVKSIQEITQAIKPGMHQEMLIRCFLQGESGKPTEIPEWMEKPKPKPAKRKGRPAKKKREAKSQLPEPLKAQPLVEAEAGASSE